MLVLNKNGMDDLIARLSSRPSKGVDCADSLLNMVYRGLTPKTLTLFSANSNGGKTTFLIQNAANIAVNHNKKVLFISIEQDVEEIGSLFISCVTGVNRNHIFTEDMTIEDRQIIDQKKKDLETLLANIHIEYIGNLNNYDDIIKIIQDEHCEYLFFDYISDDLISSTTSRLDILLKKVTATLKEIATNYNIAVMSGTQLNNNARSDDYVIRDAKWIRGSFAIADKADVAMIASGEFNQFEKDIIDRAQSFDLIKNANLVIDVYKNRKGQNHLKVFRQIDFTNSTYRDIAVYNEVGANITYTIKSPYVKKGI